MKKQAVAFFLALIILVGVTTQSADARGVGTTVNITFSGTTATCTFKVIEAGSDIKVTMTLWQGSKQIASWIGTGNGLVQMSEQCAVVKGQTYTLEVSFTVDGRTQPVQSTTKTNS